MKSYFCSIIAGIFFCSCLTSCNSRKSEELKGEVFITTEGGDTKTLAGMLIKFYSRDNLKQSIEKSLSTSTNEIPPYDPEIIKLKQKLKDLREMPLDGSAIAYNNSIFETIKTTIKYIEVLEYLKKEWPHASYYFSKFPPAELETRTDSTGKFSIDLPKGDWVLVAENHRNVGADTDEYYYWTLPVEGKKSITLSNHNMVTSNSPESLLQTAVSNKPWHP